VFVIEDHRCVLVGIAALLAARTPRDALAGPGRVRLARNDDCARERTKARAGAILMRQGLTDRRVLIATVFSFFLVCCNFGTVFWLPQILKSLGQLTNLQVGQLSVVPFLIGGIGMIFWGRHSDRDHDRRWHLVASGVLAMWHTLAGLASTPTVSFVGLCLCRPGSGACSGFLGGRCQSARRPAAAAGLAFISSVGTRCSRRAGAMGYIAIPGVQGQPAHCRVRGAAAVIAAALCATGPETTPA
jgi:ACS family tartrate transporter-like MFS transporter